MDEIAELVRRARRGMDLGLTPTLRALDELGHPERAFAVAHVAGSNGKGSACAMIDAIAREAGLSVGLYTSPHLCRFAERIRVGGIPISEEAFRRSLRAVLALDEELTFFESLTVAALHAFREAKVDLAVIEVGLGGRLDATNAVDAPLVTAITSIALEHTAILGTTERAIAREKAGIAKRGVPLVLGELAPDALDEACRVAARVDAPIALAPALDPRWPLGLRGPHQTRNAAVAAEVARRLAPRFAGIDRFIERGLAHASWPGRFERVAAPDHPGVAVLFDCAHNPHGVEALVQALDEDGVDLERTVLVFGALADKAWPEMLAALAPRATRRVYAEPEGRTAAAASDLARVAPGEAIRNPRRALTRALELARPGDTVLCAGSIYLVGAVRGALLGIPCDPVIAL